jgi:endonuclease-3
LTKKEKAARIGHILDDLYPAPPIPLAHADPFSLLVAVVLSAQTTDVQVNKVTPALFAKAPTPQKLAALSESQILALIRSCGLAPGKARNIRKLAQTLVDEHGGNVPADFDALERLPGVGHKTASVVMSQAFGQPAFAVDTHIHRLAARWGLSSGKNVEQTERDLKSVFPPEEWSKRHLQMIYFGREYCPARNHDPDGCPICAWIPGAAKSNRSRPRSR